VNGTVEGYTVTFGTRRVRFVPNARNVKESRAKIVRQRNGYTTRVASKHQNV